MPSSIRRGEVGYEDARRALVWNDRVPARFPATILRPDSALEVAQIVRDRVAAGERIAVRSGGHNWLGASLRDGGAVLDLRALNAVTVDAAARTATVGAGATHQILADAIAPNGLAFPIGHCPSVGLGGYLLAGGMGWNLHEWGVAAANVLAAEVVLADGSIEQVDGAHHPDLFWALRGGSAGFPGIVTSFTLQLRALPVILVRHIHHSLGRLPEMLDRIHRYLPDHAGTEIAVIARRPVRDTRLPPRIVVACTAFGETEQQARTRLHDAVETLALRGGAIEDSGCTTVAFDQLEGEGGWVEGLRYHADTAWSAEPAAMGRRVSDAIADAPSPDSRVVLSFAHLPGDEPDIAFTRMGDLAASFYATWREEVNDEANVEWIRRSSRTLGSLARGHYIGESDLGADPGRLALSYPAQKLERLRRVIASYDPGGRFHSFLDVA
jgi:FAD/FMN-containing dehydrogenase